jgi:hypothetical protein
MEVFEVKSTKDKLIITLDRSAVSPKFVVNLLERLRIEQLVQKADFDEDVLELSEKIKKEWWAKNKKRFLGKRKNGGRN